MRFRPKINYIPKPLKNRFLYLLFLTALFGLAACDFSGGNNAETLLIESLEYELDTIQRKAQNDSGQIYLSLRVEDFIINGPQDDRLKGLQGKIRERLIRNNLNFEGEFTNYGVLYDSLNLEYLRLLKGDYPPVEAWYLSQSLKVPYNQNGLFCLLSAHESFTGGSHSNTFLDAQVYRLNDTLQLPLDSIIRFNRADELRNLSEAYFRNTFGIEETESLEAAGFWFKDNVFQLAETFWLDTNGLHFHYNENEIAPYLKGDFYLNIPYDDLQSILKAPYILNSIREEPNPDS